MAAATQVATKTAPFGMPASPRMAGLTKMIYAIVRKVVSPAISSVRTSVPFSLSLKKFSSSCIVYVSLIIVVFGFLAAVLRRLMRSSGKILCYGMGSQLCSVGNIDYSGVMITAPATALIALQLWPPKIFRA